MIYKICTKDQWQAATENGRFEGAPVDLKDGYIHFSTSRQVAETAAKHFSGQKDLLLLAVDEAQMGDRLKWEKSRGGDLFPHLYDVLSVDDVVEVMDLKLGPDGVHQFPKLA